MLERTSPEASDSIDTLCILTGRFNTTFFTSEVFADNGTWLANPAAVLMGIVTAGGAVGTNGSVGTVVVKLSNPVYALHLSLV
jgi:hypothetical protein